ncbi:High-affinity nickel-transporter [Paenibacillus sp. GD4]|uniref:HoxN/HupN/NixA family nickel/cobalt transporter n=1 Tax=Paenibacillus sp. GD4 TaxID=3068890 RepID=UPI00279649DF|nr:High-affinity nickel-transporter [Paenibacillus sp. GD4]MDQ1910255.1 High-affinity nickel-transporter [Paenibacillus sp. GD4]
MEMVMVPLTMVILGLRHGFDSDHIAAIADMVGTETGKFRRMVGLGLTYALGHGLIVLAVGLLVLYAGSSLPESLLGTMESLVGVSLVILGLVLVAATIKQRREGVYISRLKLVEGIIRKLTGRRERTEASLKRYGLAGAFVIGILHGIGAETPTQVALISSAASLSDIAGAALQIILFTVGLLAATALITLFASWGFTMVRLYRKVLLGLGLLTGGYSLYLGGSMLWNG